MARLSAILRKIGGGFSALARSLESPTQAITADELANILSGPESDAGIRINRESALKFSPVWAAVRRISGDVAKLPIVVYDIGDDNAKTKAKRSPLYNLLRYEPNPYTTAKTFKETITAHLLLEGAAYAYIDWDLAAMTPRSLTILDPASIWPVKVANENTGLATVKYYWYKAGKNPVFIDPMFILHFPGLGFDGLNSYSVISYAANSLGFGISAQKFGSRYFRNNATPGLAVTVPQTMSDEAYSRLKKDWKSIYGGDNQHSAAILENGATVSELKINAKDALLVDALKFSITDVANWFLIPPHKLGDSSRTAYNSIEAENQSYLSETIDNWLVTIEEELRKKLLTEAQKEGETATIEFLRQAAIRVDMGARSNYYGKALANGPWMTINEVRALENLNPIEGGDVLRVPTNNLNPVAEPAPEPETEAEPEDESPDAEEPAAPDNARAVLAACRALDDAKKRCRRRLALQARKDKSITADALRANNETILREMLAPAAAVLSALVPDRTDAEIIADAIAETINETKKENE